MDKLVKILKKIKLRNLIVLIFLLIFNTYAWFVYATRVSTGITAHVSSWNVEFTTGTGESITNILIEVDRIYPGMTTFERTIDVYNKGETEAIIDYEFEELRIMQDVYTVGKTLTEEELENKVKTEYPFKINVTKEDGRQR